MTLPEFIGWIRQEHSCCMVSSATENKCSLRLSNFAGDSLAIISGTRFQKNHNFVGKLADRIIFSAKSGGFVCVAELKSGKWKTTDTIEQVQNGFKIAATLLSGTKVNSWYPLVLSNTGPKAIDVKVIQKDTIAFQGDSLRLQHLHCNTELSQIVN